ncbi:TolC family protein [Gemmatimonas aurantiaca]|uniref:TolC family protein n=1 Tax=Gemmatimonas aurantiaca TaxID=173480 RepID=UPI00301DCE71
MKIPVNSHVFVRTVVLALGLAGAVMPSVASAQPAASTGAILTLTDALALARRNNPDLQKSLNARRTAAANARAATGALLPSLSTSFGGGYREGRQTFFQGQGFGSTNDQLSTDVGASAQMNFSMASLNDRRAVKASQEATEFDIQAAEQALRNNVTMQYLTALQQQARAQLQDTLLVTTEAQLQLAQARLQVGSGTQLDVQRAEVTHGQQRVAALNARNQTAIEIVRLYQILGMPAVLETRLDPTLPPTPTLDLQQVLDNARRDNPMLDAARTRESGARRSVASARSAYIPSLSLSASLSGFTNRYTNTDVLIQQGQAGVLSQRSSCIRSEEVRAKLGLDNNLGACQALAFSPADEQAIRDSQGKYPFDFTRNPYSLSASFSLPIFNGFRREQQIEQASVQQRNAQHDVRLQELRISADVTAAYLQLNNAQQTVALQEENVRTARTALSLAQERYRVGAISIVDLVQARGDYERAETDRITAVYDVQRAFAALENAVGRPLR